MSTMPLDAAWQTLLPTALIGSQKRPLSVLPLPDHLAPLATKLTQTDEHAVATLNLAALLFQVERVAQQGETYLSEDQNQNQNQDKLTKNELIKTKLEKLQAYQPPISYSFWITLYDLLNPYYEQNRMAQICFKNHAKAPQNTPIPVTLWPQLLEKATSYSEYRPWIKTILDETGDWLVQQNPRWQQWVSKTPHPSWSPHAQIQTNGIEKDAFMVLWDEGTLADRIDAFHQMRHHSPAMARQTLEASWSQLPLNERQEILPHMIVGLSQDDEALLEKIMNSDRAASVREIAKNVLIQLPKSSFVNTSIKRLWACFDETTHQTLTAHLDLAKSTEAATTSTSTSTSTSTNWIDKIKNKTKALIALGEKDKSDLSKWNLNFILPNEADPAWKKQGIEDKRPAHESLGEKAWWLYQFIRQIPLAWWQHELRIEPTVWVTWAVQSDWAEAILRGWYDVWLLQHEYESLKNQGWSSTLQAWAVALHAAKKTKLVNPKLLKSLWHQEALEASWKEQLDQAIKKSFVLDWFLEKNEISIILPIDQPLSDTFTQYMLDQLPQCLTPPKDAKARKHFDDLIGHTYQNMLRFQKIIWCTSPQFASQWLAIFKAVEKAHPEVTYKEMHTLIGLIEVWAFFHVQSHATSEVF